MEFLQPVLGPLGCTVCITCIENEWNSSVCMFLDHSMAVSRPMPWHCILGTKKFFVQWTFALVCHRSDITKHVDMALSERWYICAVLIVFNLPTQPITIGYCGGSPGHTELWGCCWDCCKIYVEQCYYFYLIGIFILACFLFSVSPERTWLYMYTSRGGRTWSSNYRSWHAWTHINMHSAIYNSCDYTRALLSRGHWFTRYWLVSTSCGLAPKSHIRGGMTQWGLNMRLLMLGWGKSLPGVDVCICVCAWLGLNDQGHFWNE